MRDTKPYEEEFMKMKLGRELNLDLSVKKRIEFGNLERIENGDLLSN